MRHFFSTRVRVVLVVSLLVAALLAVASGVTGKNIPSMLVQSMLKPLRSGANTVVGQAEQIYDYIFRFEALEAENAQLKEQLSAAQEDARDVDSLLREIERLRKLAQLYGCSAAYLQGLTDWPDRLPLEEAPEASPAEAAESTENPMAYYRDLMDVMLKLSPADRATVLRFAQFLAAGQPQE